MTADRWTQAVRHQLGIGRLLPLGDARDGAWIAERAAEAVLRSAAWDAPGVRLDALRVAIADVEDTEEPVVPAPPSALPPGPLRVTAEFAATASQPLPTTANLLRATLATAATQRLGLTVAEVDLRVTGLLDEEGPGEAGVAARLPEPPSAALAGGGDEERVAAAALRGRSAAADEAELRELATEAAAGLISEDPAYSRLAARPGSASGRSAVSSVRVRSSAVPGASCSSSAAETGSAGAMVTWGSPSLGTGASSRAGGSTRAHAASRPPTHSTRPGRQGTPAGWPGALSAGPRTDSHAHIRAWVHRCGTVPDSHRIPLRRQRA